MNQNSKQQENDTNKISAYFNPAINLQAFNTLRAIVFAGLLAGLLFFYIIGAEAAELIFFFILIVIWYIGSFLIEAFVVVVGRTLRLRCALFALVDMYIMLSLFAYAGGAMLPVISAFAGYTLLATAACGLFIGVVALVTGLTAFVQGYFLGIDVTAESLVIAGLSGAAALAAAFLWKTAFPKLILSLNKGNRQEHALRKDLVAAQDESKTLRETITEMQDRLNQLGQERDEALDQLNDLKTESEPSPSAQIETEPEEKEEAIEPEEKEEAIEPEEKEEAIEPEEKEEAIEPEEKEEAIEPEEKEEAIEPEGVIAQEAASDLEITDDDHEALVKSAFEEASKSDGDKHVEKDTQ